MPRQTTPGRPQRRAAERGAGGTPAERLVRAWLDGDDGAFEGLAEACIAGGRDGVLAVAQRKLSGKHEEEAVEAFVAALTAVAEVAAGGERFDAAELLLLPVAVAGPPPDPAPFTAGRAGSGAFPPEAEARFAEGWRSAEAVLSLSPCALRRVLLDLVSGRPPADLPPLADGGMAEGGGAGMGAVLLRVGALVLRAGPSGADPGADPEALAVAEAGAAERSEAFGRWRAALDHEATRDAVVLPVCAPSDLVVEIAALLEDVEGVGDRDPALEEAVDFVEAARAEASEEEVMARPAGT